MLHDLFYYQGLHLVLKNAGEDLTECNLTLPLIYLLKHGKEEEKETILAALGGEPGLFTEIRRMIMSSQAFHYTLDLAKEKTEQAARALSKLPSSSYKDKGHELLDFITDRCAIS